MAPGTDNGLDVRMAVNEHYPSLMPTLYPGLMATKLRPFGTLDAMWSAFQALSHNKTPAINGKICSSLPTSSSGVQSYASWGPRPPGNGRGQGQTHSQSLARLMGSRNKLETMVQRSQNRIVGNDRSTIAKMDRKRLTNDPKTGSLETIIRRS